MDVYISTVDRTVDPAGQPLAGKRNFLVATLRSLERSAWIGRTYLFFNSPWTTYAPTARPHVIPKPIDDTEFAAIANRPTHYRAFYNYWRILSHASRACVVLEDDVRLAENWYELLAYTIDEVERKQNRYVLALYCCYEDSTESTSYTWRYPAKNFYGTQGMFYPASIRSELANFLHQHGVRRFREPYDLAIKRFCIENQVPILACRRSLLQHTAPRDSTGLGGDHQTSSFQTRVEHATSASVFRASNGHASPIRGGYEISLEQQPNPVACNGPAALVWSLCDGKRTLGDIAREIASTFAQPLERIEHQVARAATELSARFALDETGEPPRVQSDPPASSLARFCSCRLRGGLGNQMFQVAVTLSYAQRHNLVPLIPQLQWGGAFDHALIQVDSPPPNGRVYSEPEFSHRELPCDTGIVLDGYFQSERYFDEPTVRKFLTPDPAVIRALKRRHRVLLEQEPISLHVRRGDYLSMPDFHPVLPVGYYARALSRFDDRRTVAVFSDDIAWCRANLAFDNLV
ncbi:MAG: PqqD family peptide modification chaperone, partial [Proteobacteria bacterium]